MIHVLVTDDDEHKRAKITECVRDALGARALKVSVAASVVAAAKLMETEQATLLLLDLNLPIRDGEAPKKEGGLALLHQLSKAGPRFQKPKYIVGLSAYSELVEKHEPEFSAHGWQLLFFDPTNDTWYTTLQNLLQHAHGAFEQRREYQVDLAIITALKAIELEAVLALEGNWREERVVGDDTVYHRGIFQRGDVKISVIAAACAEMGMTASASLATKLIMQFRPRVIAMAGIAAGVDDKAKFGDVMFASQAWDYGSGKIKTDKEAGSVFAPSPNYALADSALKEGADVYASGGRDAVLASIHQRWRATRIDSVLRVLVGPMASGAAVVENTALVKEIKEFNRKVIGVEMEVYGLYFAVKSVPLPRPMVFAAKSVCDFAVPPKTDEYQRYAAYTSANFILEFAFDQVVPLLGRNG